MANFEDAGTNPVYNYGVVRVPGIGTGTGKSAGAVEQLFADLLERDIVGGQVAQNFVGDVGAPLANTASKPGHVELAAPNATEVAGLLLAATDAYDGPRHVNVVKGGTVKTTVGALRGKDDAALKALATALNGTYDPVFKTIKF